MRTIFTGGMTPFSSQPERLLQFYCLNLGHFKFLIPHLFSFQLQISICPHFALAGGRRVLLISGITFDLLRILFLEYLEYLKETGDPVGRRCELKDL